MWKILTEHCWISKTEIYRILNENFNKRMLHTRLALPLFTVKQRCENVPIESLKIFYNRVFASIGTWVHHVRCANRRNNGLKVENRHQRRRRQFLLLVRISCWCVGRKCVVNVRWKSMTWSSNYFLKQTKINNKLKDVFFGGEIQEYST